MLKYRSSFYKWALYAIIPFFGFYTVKIGVSPIYFSFCYSLFLILIGSIQGIKPIDDFRFLFIPSIILFYAFFAFLFFWRNNYSSISAWVNFIFSFLYFIITMLILNNVKKDNIFSAVNLAIKFSIALLSVEFAYRILNPAQPEEWTMIRDDIEWYMYKTSSFMYPDSNSVGLFIACLMAFVMGVPEDERQPFKKYLLPLFLLLLGTLSRASIFAVVFLIVYRYFSRFNYKNIVVTIFLIIASAVIYSLISADESFLSKFWIAGLVLDYLSNANLLALMVGVGPGNAEQVLGVGAHLLPFMLLIETGIWGVTIISVLWIAIWGKTRQHGTPIFIVFLVNGLSFSTFATPWFYAMLAVLIYFSRERRNASLSTDSRL